MVGRGPVKFEGFEWNRLNQNQTKPNEMQQNVNRVHALWDPQGSFWHGVSQWETTLQCNVFSHGLSPYPESPLDPLHILWVKCDTDPILTSILRICGEWSCCHCVWVYQEGLPTPTKRSLVAQCSSRECSQGNAEMRENLEQRWQRRGMNTKSQVDRRTCCLSGRVPIRTRGPQRHFTQQLRPISQSKQQAWGWGQNPPPPPPPNIATPSVALPSRSGTGHLPVWQRLTL